MNQKKNDEMQIVNGTLTRLGEAEDVLFPRSMENISEEILEEFFFHRHIRSITVEDGNPRYFAAGNCLIDRRSGELVLGCTNSVIPGDGSVTAIGTAAFDGVPLREIDIPDSVVSLGCGAFANTELCRISLPKNLQHIGSFAFMGTDLTELTLPAAVKKVEWGAFRSCRLERISVDKENPYYSDEDNCLSERRTHTLLFCAAGGELPADTLTVERLALAERGGSSITIPAGVQKIRRTRVRGEYAPLMVDFPGEAGDIITFRVTSGSYAHRFAKRNHIPFELM